ncbi:MAG: amidohydrolase family protein [Gammaproteobacteria bacterium]
MQRTSLKRAGLYFAAVLILAAVTAAETTTQDSTEAPLVILGARLVDTSVAGPGEPVTVLVQDQIIHAVAGEVEIPSDARVIDARGKYLLPGLADMHNHLRSGTFLPGDKPAEILQQMLPWGITTVFDPAVHGAAYQLLRDEIGKDPDAYPRVFLTAGLFTAPKGWGRGHQPLSAAEARTVVQSMQASGSDAVKLMYDDMSWATTRPFAVLDRAVMAAIIDEAHRLGMKAFVHAPVLELAAEAVEANVDCLLHGIISDPVSPEFIESMLEHGTCYMSTLTMFHTNAGYAAWADRLEEFDKYERLDPAILDAFRLPAVQGGTARLDNTAYAARQLPVLRENLLRVANAGVPIVIGTDTGIPGVLPGIALQLELVMHVDAGLSPRQALNAATRNAAAMLDQASVFGSIEPGLAADILILDANPLEDIRNIRDIYRVIHAGRVYDPELAR